jgi:hypothetical protein
VVTTADGNVIAATPTVAHNSTVVARLRDKL